MTRTDHQKNRRWTPPEVGIWLLALLLIIVIGILNVTNVVGPWTLVVGGGVVTAVGLLRYRAETERASRNTDDRDGPSA